MKRILLALFLMCSLSGCSSFDVYQYDKNHRFYNKSMAVPIGGFLEGHIKLILSNQFGWKISTYQKSTESSGVYKNISNSRYTMIVNRSFYANDEKSFSIGKGLYLVDISIVDSKTENEVCSISGAGSLPAILKSILETLEPSLDFANEHNLDRENDRYIVMDSAWNKI